MSNTSAGAAAVDTGKVAGRRVLRFETFEEMWAEVERCAAAGRAGRLKVMGNWSLGQIFGHLASWASFPYEGYPPELHAPWMIRLILKMRKKRFLWGQMPAGIRIPGVEGGTKGTEPMGLEEGLTRLRRAWDRLNAEPPRINNPIFGPLTHEEWKAINLRHGELHLGFVAEGA
jgi:hypothetical protein